MAESVRLLDRYISGTILRQSSLVFIVLMGIFLFMVFIEELADIGVGNYDLASVFRFVALSAPRIAYETFPMVALIVSGVRFGIGCYPSEWGLARENYGFGAAHWWVFHGRRNSGWRVRQSME